MKTRLYGFFMKKMGINKGLTGAHHYLFWLTMLAPLVLTSCMLVPYADMDPVDKTKPVQFVGAVITPNSTVTIQAQDPQSKGWSNIGQATSLGSDFPGGSSQYIWSTWLTIPSKYWTEGQICASTGESALVRSQWNSVSLPTTTKDAGNCYSNHPGADFLTYCKGPESPNVRVGALGYRDFGKECANRINYIRALEGKPALEIDEAGECVADSDAKCNYEWELSNPEAHHCFHGSAQNECSYKSAQSIDGILDDCIWQQMYKIEKVNYQNNPSNCYSAPWPNGCGHYVNMVVSNYTKISCGLYKTPNGLFKSVQNFK
jgi:hypothetical protein